MAFGVNSCIGWLAGVVCTEQMFNAIFWHNIACFYGSCFGGW